jgi:hypothetical protein
MKTYTVIFESGVVVTLESYNIMDAINEALTKALELPIRANITAVIKHESH